ncbi:Fc.00g102450.m01.CDS01 [Cosmosporella sp. VM-42]
MKDEQHTQGQESPAIRNEMATPTDVPTNNINMTRLGSKDLEPDDLPNPKKTIRFWSLMVAISFAGLLTALEATITSTALPSIIADLGGGDLYIWAVNGYLLAMTSLQPLYGQLANVFGRRWPMITATAAFVLGSGICGGARNMPTLIAGRIIQGVGAGGINVLIEIIVCDLVPLRERGKYLAFTMGVVATGTSLGPFFGGLIVQYSSWRWVFYLALPVGGVALVMLLLCLKVQYNKEATLATKLTKIDWTGNALFVGSISSVLIALAWAGVVHPWSSYEVLLPLLVGFVGMAGFFVFEGSRFAEQPIIPLHLFSNRTSATAFIMTFIHGIVAMWTLYFLPVYFQGVLGSSPSRSGLQILPTILVMIPFAATGGGLLSKFGKYRLIHIISWALMIVGFGLLTLLNEHSGTGAWVGIQVVEAAGVGLIIPTLLPVVMAPLTEADTGLATATWAFMRSFGMTWGTAIPAAIFNNRFDQLAPTRISDEALRAEVGGGRAYEHATAAFLKVLSPENRAEFASVLNESLHRSWQIAIVFAALGFLLVALEKEIHLRTELKTEFGLDNVDQTTTDKE